MSKKYIALIIALFLLPAFLMTGCGPAPGGGNNGVLPIIVTFNPQGGAVDPKSKEVTVGSTYGELPLPTKPDSTFLGWFTEKTGGTEVTSSTKVTNTKSHTLYAQWSGPITAKTVTVTFDPQEGTVDPASKEVTVGSAYGTLPTPSPPSSSLKFNGWFTEEVGGNKVTEDTTVTKEYDHTLYAHWGPYTPKTVTITFDTRGGYSSSMTTIDPKTVTVGSAYGDLPKVFLPYSFFEGWFTAPAGGTKVTSTTIVTIDQDHTLYAQWIPLVDVTFDPQGGTVSPKAKLVVPGYTYGTLPTPSPPSIIKKFIGWFTAPVGGTEVTSTTIVTIDHHHTLYAHWKNIL